MIRILVATLILITASARAETLILPISDLLIEIPNYEAPKLNLGASLNGRYEIQNIKKETRINKELRSKLIQLAYDMHPDAKSVRIYNNSLIIKF